MVWENRCNMGKGTHLVLKRAEKARTFVSKMPGNNIILDLFLCNSQESVIIVE
jgi:hypothetical protein